MREIQEGMMMPRYGLFWVRWYDQYKNRKKSLVFTCGLPFWWKRPTVMSMYREKKWMQLVLMVSRERVRLGFWEW